MFYTMPPLTPTSPMVAPPCPFPVTPTGGVTPTAPFALNCFADDLDSIMNLSPDLESSLTEGEVQAFVDIMTYVYCIGCLL